MNDTLAPVRSLDSDRLLITSSAAVGAHLTLVDRVELRIGLWLLLRSARRHDDARDHAAHGRRAANARALAARQHTALRAHALNGVRT